MRGISPDYFSAMGIAVRRGRAFTAADRNGAPPVSYFVTQRTQEIGIRIALGAARPDVVRMVVGRGLVLALAGLAIGVGAAVPLMRWREDLLFEVKPTDPLTFAAAAGVIAAVAILASYLPARRAANVEPMAALRAE